MHFGVRAGLRCGADPSSADEKHFTYRTGLQAATGSYVRMSTRVSDDADRLCDPVRSLSRAAPSQSASV